MTRFPFPTIRDDIKKKRRQDDWIKWYNKEGREERKSTDNPGVRITIEPRYPEQTEENHKITDHFNMEPLPSEVREGLWEGLVARLSCDKITFGYQNARSPSIEIILQFHDWLIIFLITIARVILRIIRLIRKPNNFRLISDSESVEYAWTLIPCIILILLFLPSLRLLYIVDERRAGLTVKAVGRQWYWEYEYPEFPRFDSYITKRDYRFLEADKRLVTPNETPTQVLITAADVLHSWTIPAMAVKADAVPGRINKQTLIPLRPGVYHGQCSEICGRNHRFMPIALECI